MIVKIEPDACLIRGMDATGKGRQFPDLLVKRDVAFSQKVTWRGSIYTLQRRQFPFQFDCCKTLSSIAGLTFPEGSIGIIDNTRTMDYNSLYLGISRFKDPKQIFLVHPVTHQPNQRKVSEGFPFFDVSCYLSGKKFNEQILEIVSRTGKIIFPARMLKPQPKNK